MTDTKQIPFHPRRRRRRRSKRRKSASPTPQALYPIVGAYRAQHLVLSQQHIETDLGRVSVVIDEIESPLGWLARRRGRDGRPLIEVHQLQSGERLRTDFTRARAPHPTGPIRWRPLVAAAEAIVPI